MAVDVSIKIENQQVSAALARLRLALPLRGDMTPAMQIIGRALKTGAHLRFRAQQAPDGTPWEKSMRAQGAEGGQTLRLSSRLRNSLRWEATRDSVTIGTNVVYAAIHQFGGIIRAKKGPFLAIPVSAEARKAGSPRKMKGLVFKETVKGKLALIDPKTGTVHFLLRTQVKMPARPFLGASDSDTAEIVRAITEHLERAWKR